MKCISFLSVLIITSFVLANTPETNVSISKVTCQSTAYEPGMPRDYFTLQKNDNDRFSAFFAKGSTQEQSVMQKLSDDLICEFASNNNFLCEINAGSISNTLVTRTQLYLPDTEPQSVVSLEIAIVGYGFGSLIPSGVEVLYFMFADNCKYE